MSTAISQIGKSLYGAGYPERLTKALCQHNRIELAELVQIAHGAMPTPTWIRRALPMVICAEIKSRTRINTSLESLGAL
ncbi:hypothetical protein ACELLULO517_15660 [Acidisoma cellulosilytica]|uniref:Uncharacterized protein n=1 Tax=Acidisoma cellulosilyticum TaxID=2802395 RepID=A0A964E4N7_9PROT|nr:hypothetical protein [Acidisoma cellulosilyticum]MCB8881684.1 hypothetical protein [Acidisoma cellulosilyticum]